MIIIKTAKEIEAIRKGGKILAEVLEQLIKIVKPGITTGDLEDLTNELIGQAGGRPSFKGYKATSSSRAYPTALCASINNEIVHAPSLPARVLNSGDIIGLDLGMEYPYGADKHGYYTDMAKTVVVGKINKETRRLLNVTEKSLSLAIDQVKPGKTLRDIGRAIEKYVEKEGFSVVRDLVGHGVGIAVHEDPQIPNYEITGSGFENTILKPGMVIAIEPMVNNGDWRIKNGRDGFTITTVDGSLSAHFEHTVVVTENGHEVVTKL
jgi:methionyl aminopeptidase